MCITYRYETFSQTHAFHCRLSKESLQLPRHLEAAVGSLVSSANVQIKPLALQDKTKVKPQRCKETS